MTSIQERRGGRSEMFKTIRTGVNKLKQAFVILFALAALTMQPNVAIAQTASNALDFIYIDEPTLFPWRFATHCICVE